MSIGLSIALASAGIGTASAIGMSIYALVLRSRLADAHTAADVAIDKMHLSDAKAAAATTKLINAAAVIERLENALRTERARKLEAYADHAERGDPGGGDAVDDALLGLYPDADRDALRAGRAASREVSGEIAGPATDADEDDLFRRGR